MRYILLALILACAPAWGQTYNLTPLPNHYQSAVPISPAPTGTTSATRVMMGIGATITPKSFGVVTLNVAGNLTSDTIGDGANVDVRFGTGAAPANGDAVTGTKCAGDAILSAAVTVTDRYPFSFVCVITGLTVGTPIWMDAGVLALTGGTASLTQVNVSAITK